MLYFLKSKFNQGSIEFLHMGPYYSIVREIQVLTSYPENVLLRGHRKCIDSVHLSVVW